MAIRGPYDSASASGTPRTLGERIRMLRVQRGLTQVELGTALSTDQATISLWERDRAHPAGAAMAGIAAFFGTTAQALETGEGLSCQVPSAHQGREPRERRTDFGLPEAQPGELLAMDLRVGSEGRMEAMEAMAFLMKAIKEGRSVWIVAD